MTLVTDHLRLGPVVFRGRTYSPEFVTQQIDAVARYLDRYCAGRSPIVYLVATNHWKTVAAYFGIIKCGRVCLLVDPACRALEWAEMTRDAPPSAVIRFDPSTDAFNLERETTLHGVVLDSESTSELEGVCTMLFTAADDGYAKAAMLTHENMLANATTLVEHGGIDETTPSCSLIPFHHLFALQTGVIIPAIGGAAICVLGPELSNLRASSAELRAARVARFYSVPAVLYLLGKAWSPKDASSIPAVLVSGGTRLPPRISQHYREAFGREIHEGYGLTEAAPVCTWHYPTDRIRPGSVGHSLSCCELRVEDDSGNALPVGSVGEVCVRGTNVMKRYFRQPVASGHALRGGWLHTGDLGRLDHDGFLYLTGLRKRMLNVAGKKVYPAEVERMMRLYDNVEDVTIAGEPQLIQGETVVSRVRLRTRSAEAEQAFKRWCLENISAHKIPARIQFE
jgi:long-chain acyl-CoA synthetase